MSNLMRNGINCNDVYLQRCFNHLILSTFIQKFKIFEINIISSGCPKNNTGYGILEKKLRDIGIRQKIVRDIRIETPLKNSLIKKFTSLFNLIVLNTTNLSNSIHSQAFLKDTIFLVLISGVKLFVIGLRAALMDTATYFLSGIYLFIFLFP